jgi:hypothetical protein
VWAGEEKRFEKSALRLKPAGLNLSTGTGPAKASDFGNRIAQDESDRKPRSSTRTVAGPGCACERGDRKELKTRAARYDPRSLRRKAALDRQNEPKWVGNTQGATERNLRCYLLPRTSQSRLEGSLSQSALTALRQDGQLIMACARARPVPSFKAVRGGLSAV